MLSWRNLKHPQSIYLYPDSSSKWSSVLICQQKLFPMESLISCSLNNATIENNIATHSSLSATLLPAVAFTHSHTHVPTHALIWPQETPVTVSGPLPWEDKLPVMTTTFCGIHIRRKTKEVLRSRGITLKLFILCFLLPSPFCLSPTLFCQLTTRAPVSPPLFLSWIFGMESK